MIAMALACNLISSSQMSRPQRSTLPFKADFGPFAFKAKKGCLFFTSLDLNVVANIADRIYVMYAGVVAEQGSRQAIFRDPRHPYTQGLLASLPSRAKRGSTLRSIPGTVPDPAYKPRGCPFHPRCPHAIERCRQEFPGLCDYGDGHLARCPVLYEGERIKVKG
jgi:oligopeptide/dipeptide ABC transporter ATP-binding protein